MVNTGAIAQPPIPKRVGLSKKKKKSLKDRIKSFDKNKKKNKRAIASGVMRRPNLETLGIHYQRENKMEVLKNNKVPLTDDERSECMKSKAVWHHGPNGEETPAVWKSKNKDGSFTYITNTHRAYQAEDSLKGAIGKYHKFIKGTA